MTESFAGARDERILPSGVTATRADPCRWARPSTIAGADRRRTQGAAFEQDVQARAADGSARPEAAMVRARRATERIESEPRGLI